MLNETEATLISELELAIEGSLDSEGLTDILFQVVSSLATHLEDSITLDANRHHGLETYDLDAGILCDKSVDEILSARKLAEELNGVYEVYKDKLLSEIFGDAATEMMEEMEAEIERGELG